MTLSVSAVSFYPLFVCIAKTYWAKDIVFLVTSHGELGMQAWIDAYMGLQTASKICCASKLCTCMYQQRILDCYHDYCRLKKLIYNF